MLACGSICYICSAPATSLYTAAFVQVRGTELNSPHGVPVDLLDRLLIIRTLPYALEDMIHILAIRAQVGHSCM